MIKEIAFICSILFAPYLKDNCFKTNFFESLSQANFNINQADFVSTDVEETIYELVDPGITSNPNLDIDYRTNIYHPIQGEDIPTNSFLGDEFIPDKEYMIKYFKNLQNNKIGNYLRVCGYTSPALLLYILECQTMFEHLGFMVMQKIQNIIEIKGGWSYKI